MGRKATIKKVVNVVLDGGYMPEQADDVSAGYDLRCPADVVIKKGRNVVQLGIRIGLPVGIEGNIRPRSGFSAKGMEGYTIPRFKWLKSKLKRFDADVIEGTVDCGYHNGIGVIIKNYDKPFLIKKGTRIAQIVFSVHELPQLHETEELEGYDRGGGFGHTGTK